MLRKQIGGKRMRFTDGQRRRLARRAKELGRKLLVQVATIVSPETLMAWHRKLIAKKCDGTSFRQPGRRPTVEEIADSVVRMAKENSNWGYRRIQGGLANLGQLLAHNTIANILKGKGIQPAPEPVGRQLPRNSFDATLRTDRGQRLFQCEVWTKKGLQRCVVLFFIDLSTRRVVIPGASGFRLSSRFQIAMSLFFRKSISFGPLGLSEFTLGQAGGVAIDARDHI